MVIVENVKGVVGGLLVARNGHLVRSCSTLTVGGKEKSWNDVLPPPFVRFATHVGR